MSINRYFEEYVNWYSINWSSSGIIEEKIMFGYEAFVDKHGVLTIAVKIIFSCLQVSVTSIEHANEFAQKHFLRSSERWNGQEKRSWHDLMHQNKETLLQAFRSLGMIDAVLPRQNMYTYILVMGTLKNNAEQCFDFLAELKRKGLSFEKIILLSGKRLLEDFEKTGLPVDVVTEAEMMLYLCSRHGGFKDDEIVLVDAPMIHYEDGTVTRPTTDSTLAYFAQTACVDGSCLVISENPHIIRQTKVAQRILDQTRFPVDGAGKAIEEPIDMIQLFDEFARALYEEYKMQKK
ncbi:MAG TPA: hypothetical protein VGT41_00865 [Candidatus Babeliales bacterium]|nr:hypothetical protein [Candidatus Babeliales bacterium]